MLLKLPRKIALFDMEIWKESNSHFGVMVSSMGRVRLPVVQSKMPHGGTRVHQTKPTLGSVCKSNKNAQHEYRNIHNRRLGHMKVHQLVCDAFHGPKPFDGAVVIHINEDGLDNRAENLKWGTQKENLNMPKFLEYCRSRTGSNSPTAKAKEGF
jgi:hypothetical protein